MLPVESFTRFINHHQLFARQSRILAAVSGGKDSVLMAHLLKAAGYDFGIAHCNFQLRGEEALGDEEFCRALAEQLQVPFHHVRFNTQEYADEHQLSTQMAARELRYQWFELLRQEHQYDVIALAHHQSDTIETILLNLVRGTGIAGLHGILPVNGHIVRPLLFLNRSEIDELIQLNQFPYREDSSNSSTKYARNKIRLKVVPHLKALNPNLEKTFERNLQHFRELETLLQLQVEQARKVVMHVDNEQLSLDIDAIKQLPAPRLLLFELLKPYGFNQTTIDDLISVLDKHSGRKFESATHLLVADRGRLLLSAKGGEQVSEVLIQPTDTVVKFGNRQLTIKPSQLVQLIKDKEVAVVDEELLHYPLTLRRWQQGDEFCPLGMTGHKKLSDFLINQKVPLTQKQEIPILVNGNGQIIWVCGYRLDNRYKVGPDTKKVTIFELLKQSYDN